jgi:hypothetical protein
MDYEEFNGESGDEGEEQATEYSAKPIETDGEDTSSEEMPSTESEAPSSISSIEDIWDIPDKFENTNQALEFYATRFEVLKESLNNPDSEIYSDVVTNILAEKIKEIDKGIEGFSKAFLQLQQNPEEYLIQFHPELLAKHGIEPVLNYEQVKTKIDGQLRKEFGEDYRQKFNANDILDHGSLSSRMQQRQFELTQAFESTNERNRGLTQQWEKNLIEGKNNLNGAMTEEQIKEQVIQEHFPRFQEAGFTEESFDEFLDDAASHELTIEDIHKAIYFEAYMGKSYQQGYEEGRKAVYGKLNEEGNASTVRVPESVSKLLNTSEQERPSNTSDFGNFFEESIRKGMF